MEWIIFLITRISGALPRLDPRDTVQSAPFIRVGWSSGFQPRELLPRNCLNSRRLNLRPDSSWGIMSKWLTTRANLLELATEWIMMERKMEHKTGNDYFSLFPCWQTCRCTGIDMPKLGSSLDLFVGHIGQLIAGFKLILEQVRNYS